MAKKTGMGLPPHTKTRKVGSGTGSLKSGHSVSKDGTGGGIAGRGIEGARHHVTKPSSSSGTIGAAGPLKSTSSDSDKRNTTLGRSYLTTKPSK